MHRISSALDGLLQKTSEWLEQKSFYAKYFSFYYKLSMLCLTFVKKYMLLFDLTIDFYIRITRHIVIWNRLQRDDTHTIANPSPIYHLLSSQILTLTSPNSPALLINLHCIRLVIQ